MKTLRVPHRAAQVDYTNYRGERSLRTIVPLEFRWGSNQYHPRPGQLIIVYDVDRKAIRSYSMSGVHSWTELPLPFHVRLPDVTTDGFGNWFLKDENDAAQKS